MKNLSRWAGLLLAVSLTACGTTNTVDNNQAITTLTGQANELHRTDVNASWTAADLKKWSRGNSQVLADNTIIKDGTISADGAIKINLADTVAPEKLRKWSKSYDAECAYDYTSSNPDAEYFMDWTEFHVLSSDNINYRVMNYVSVGSSDRYNFDIAALVYSTVDTKSSISMKCDDLYTLKVDLDLKKGWNLRRYKQTVDASTGSKSILVDGKTIENGVWIVNFNSMVP